MLCNCFLLDAVLVIREKAQNNDSDGTHGIDGISNYKIKYTIVEQDKMCHNMI